MNTCQGLTFAISVGRTRITSVPSVSWHLTPSNRKCATNCRPGIDACGGYSRRLQSCNKDTLTMTTSFESIIGQAMVSGNHILGECRAACKMAAMQNITCPKCGEGLDQSRTVVIEFRTHPTKPGELSSTVQGHGAICSDCYKALDQTSRKARALVVRLACKGQRLSFLTWTGIDTITPSEAERRAVMARNPRQGRFSRGGKALNTG